MKNGRNTQNSGLEELRCQIGYQEGAVGLNHKVDIPLSKSHVQRDGPRPMARGPGSPEMTDFKSRGQLALTVGSVVAAADDAK